MEEAILKFRAKAGKLTGVITPVIEQQLKEVFNLEIELMRGTRIQQEDGLIAIEIEIPAEKADLIRTFLLKMIIHQGGGNNPN